MHAPMSQEEKEKREERCEKNSGCTMYRRNSIMHMRKYL